MLSADHERVEALVIDGAGVLSAEIEEVWTCPICCLPVPVVDPITLFESPTVEDAEVVYPAVKSAHLEVLRVDLDSMATVESPGFKGYQERTCQ